MVKASVFITRRPETIGKAFHLVSEEPPTIGMLLRLSEEEYPDIPQVQVIDPDNFRKENLPPEEQFVFMMLEPYLGYLNGHLSFDTANTRRVLQGTAIECPRTDSAFLKTLVEYAFEAGYLVSQ